MFVVLVVVFAASAVQAGTIFRYVDNTGVVSFTDSLKRVPAKYMSEAKVVPSAKLEDYRRYTHIATPATAVAPCRADGSR
jgi:hypothetical protein